VKERLAVANVAIHELASFGGDLGKLRTEPRGSVVTCVARLAAPADDGVSLNS
jgi:hypothetical protein